MSHRSARLRGSRPVVGSSRNSTLGARNEARGEVEPAAHAAREGLHRAGRRRRRGRGARAARRPGAARRASGGGAGARPSRGSCARSSARRPWPAARRRRCARARRSGSAHDVDAGDRGRCPRSGCDERGEDADRGGLAGAVVAEQTEDRARRDVEVEVAQRPEVAEALAQARGSMTPRSGSSGLRRCRMAYGLFVHSTTNISSTLYEWQPEPPASADDEPRPTLVADRRRSSRRRREDRRQGREKAAPKHEQIAAKAAHASRDASTRRRRAASTRSTCGPGPTPATAPPALHAATRSRRPRFASPTPKGFDAVSMRRIATELDAGTMTLYHYVRTKDELLTLVDRRGDGRSRRPRRASRCPTNWRDALTLIARTHARRARAPPVDPRHHRRSADRSQQRAALRPVAAGGGVARSRRSTEKFDIVIVVDEYVFGYCLHERNNLQPDARTVTTTR